MTKLAEIAAAVEAALDPTSKLLGIIERGDGEVFVAVQVDGGRYVSWLWTGRDFDLGHRFANAEDAIRDVAKRATWDVD